MSSLQFNILTQIANKNKENIINNKEYAFQLKKDINNIINNIKSIISKNIDDNILITINDYFCQINGILEIIINSFNFSIISKKQIENIQKRDEQIIRNLYGQLFREKLMIEILENKLSFSKQKESEYELLKQKTGAIICNGKVICNERKDNEIIILRTENSLLKSAIKNNEDLIQEKNYIIDNLNDDILMCKNQIEELRHIKKGEFSSFSNININIHESKNNYKKKKIYNNNDKRSINSKNLPSPSKKNKKEYAKVNYHNNIYSSYQINSLLMNKSNNSSNSKKNKREEVLDNKNNNSSKNNTTDQNNINGYFFKYISVNKSLFSPRKENKNNKKNSSSKSRQSKKNNSKNKNIFTQEYKTVSNDIHKRKDIKLIKNKIFKIHRKANSIQILENSLKKMSFECHGKKEKSLIKKTKNIFNNSSNLFSVLRKISEIKNKNLKKNSHLSSVTVNNLNNNKKNNDYSDFSMLPYTYKKNDYKGRNEKNKNNSKINEDNSFSFINKVINKTTIDSYS